MTLDRPVALKILRPPTTLSGTGRDAFLDGFIAEGKIIARISHPNIVQVYDFGVSVLPSGERAAWMALEWLTGVTLEADLAARRGAGGRTPPKRCSSSGPSSPRSRSCTRRGSRTVT